MVRAPVGQSFTHKPHLIHCSLSIIKLSKSKLSFSFQILLSFGSVYKDIIIYSAYGLTAKKSASFALHALLNSSAFSIWILKDNLFSNSSKLVTISFKYG
jgi:hypothetical protein